MDYARQSRRCVVFPGPRQLSHEPANYRIGLDLISSLDLSGVVPRQRLGRGGPNPATVFPPPALIEIAQLFFNF